MGQQDKPLPKWLRRGMLWQAISYPEALLLAWHQDAAMHSPLMEYPLPAELIPALDRLGVMEWQARQVH